MKNVLFISYYFPPAGGSCVQRSLYFVKYLPDWGYRPMVIHACEVPYGYSEDPALLRELDGRDICLTFQGHGAADIITALARWMGRYGRVGLGLAWRICWLSAWLRKDLSPDPLLPWARALVAPACSVARRHKAKVIYSTSCPYSDHYLAWRIKIETGLPWVADFRDLWTQEHNYGPHPPHRLRTDLRLERTFLLNADAIINVSAQQSQMMRSLVPERSRDRFHVLYNGVDLGCTPDRRQEHDGTFKVSYVGVMGTDQWSEAFVQAWKKAFGNLANGCKVLWQVVGRIPVNLQKMAADLGNQFRYLGYVPHEQARLFMSQSDVLLLSVNRGRGLSPDGVITGKIFEYLASGRPILCLTPVHGEAAAMVERHKAGLVANIDSVEEIYKALKSMYDAWAAGKPMRGADPSELHQYDRRVLTGQLAQIFDKVIEESRRGSRQKAKAQT